MRQIQRVTICPCATCPDSEVRIKLDENMPAELALDLRRLGHDVHTVRDEALEGTPDDRLWTAVQSEQRFFITQDMDFSDARKFAPSTHAGILLIRLSVPSRRVLTNLVTALFRDEEVEAWARCLVIASDSKLRVRR